MLKIEDKEKISNITRSKWVLYNYNKKNNDKNTN